MSEHYAVRRVTPVVSQPKLRKLSPGMIAGDRVDAQVVRMGNAMIRAACDGDSREFFSKLSSENIDLIADFQDRNGDTALHHTAARGRVEMTEFLLDNLNATINKRNNIGRTPLEVAAGHGKESIVKVLALRYPEPDSWEARNVFYEAARVAQSYNKPKTYALLRKLSEQGNEFLVVNKALRPEPARIEPEA